MPGRASGARVYQGASEMSVLVNNDTRVLVQGITGKEGSFQTQRCIEYGTKVVAGVTPGRGGEKAETACPSSTW